jgi:ssDNA-binding Zn-finger/Zn-ribbon topoisomerase 1
MSEFARGIYLLYLRKSRQDDPNETIEEVLSKHETMLQEYMKREYGFTIPEENIYREVCSGESIQERTEIKKVLARIEDDAVKGVVVIEPSRLSRGDLIDCGNLISQFRYTKSLVVTPMMTYNLENKMERKFFQDELLRGNDYLEYTKEILFRGRAASAKRGNFVGNHAPYGYDRVKVGKDWTLTPNDNAIYVKMIFDWYANEQLSTQQIARRLQEMGVPTIKAKKWEESVVRGILVNKHYLGKVFFATTKETIVIEDGERKKKTLHNNDYILVDGKHPALIDEETFNKVTERRLANLPKVKSGYGLANPFSGLIFCKKCGRALRLRYKKNYGARMSCNQRPTCYKSAPLEEITKAIISALEFSELPNLESMLNDKKGDSVNIQRNLLNNLQKQLTELKVQEEKQYDLLEKGIYSEELFDRRNSALQEKMQAVKNQITEAKNNMPKEINYADKIISLKKAINDLKDDSIPPIEKNKLLKTIIQRIEYSNDSKRYDFGVNNIKLDIYLRL